MATIRPIALPDLVDPPPSTVVVADNGTSVGKVTLSKLVDSAAPVASDVEALAGADNSKRMTPLRVKQAIDAKAATKEQGGRADSAVQPTRQVLPGVGLAGGGALSSDVTLALNPATVGSLAKADSAVQPTRQVLPGQGLAGGGPLSADVTLSLSAATQASLVKADSAIQAFGGTSGQVLVKNSTADNDVKWQDVVGATAVSYGPQTLTPSQQTQARANIGLSTIPADQLTGTVNDARLSSNVMRLDASQTNTGGKVFVSGGNIAQSDDPAMQVLAPSDTTDAFLSFHVPGKYRIQFGLRPDGSFGVGGGTIGLVFNKIWHAGNDGAGSGLDADLLDGEHLSDINNRIEVRASAWAATRAGRGEQVVWGSGIAEFGAINTNNTSNPTTLDLGSPWVMVGLRTTSAAGQIHVRGAWLRTQ